MTPSLKVWMYDRIKCNKNSITSMLGKFTAKKKKKDLIDEHFKAVEGSTADTCPGPKLH